MSAFDGTLAHNAPAAAAQCSRRGQVQLARASVNSYDSCIAAARMATLQRRQRKNSSTETNQRKCR
jgi:hypothetical protein